MKKLLYTFGFLLLAAMVQAQLPNGWSNTDLGSPLVPGSAAYDDATGVFTLHGSGLNFWDTDDGHFAYVQIDGDFEFIARVVTFLSETGLGGSAKTGIDARSSLDTDAPSFMMSWEDWGGLAVTSRGGPGVTPEWTGANFPGADAIPWYLKVVRTGDDFTASESQDSITWTETAVKTMSSMLPTIYVGLAISPNSDNVAVATFDRVTIVGNVILNTEEPNLNQALRVFPNPVSDQLNFNFLQDQTIQRVMVTDLSGAVIGQYAPQNSIDVSNLAPGMYLLQAGTDQGLAVRKFVKL